MGHKLKSTFWSVDTWGKSLSLGATTLSHTFNGSFAPTARYGAPCSIFGANRSSVDTANADEVEPPLPDLDEWYETFGRKPSMSSSTPVFGQTVGSTWYSWIGDALCEVLEVLKEE